MESLIITSNYTNGYGKVTNNDFAFHIENYSRNLVISDNVFHDCDNGIAVYGLSDAHAITGNVIHGREGHAAEADASAFSDPTTGFGNGAGIYLVNDGDGSALQVSMTGNAVTNSNLGYVLAGRFSGDAIIGNTASLCSAAWVFSGSFMGAGMAGNSASHCKYVLNPYTANTNVAVEGIAAINCSDLLNPTAFAASDGALMLHDLKWSFVTASLSATGNTDVDLFTAPDGFKFEADVLSVRDGASNNGRISSITAEDPGTGTITATRNWEVSGELPAIYPNPTTPFLLTSGKLQMKFYNSSTAATADVTIKMRGLLAYADT